jgi:hypothetical protein
MSETVGYQQPRLFVAFFRIGGCGNGIRVFLLTTVATNKREEQAGRQRSTLPLSIATAKQRKKKKNPTILQAFSMKLLSTRGASRRSFFLEGDRSSSVWRL